MKKFLKINLILIIVGIALSGCASSGVIELDKGTYYISKSDGTPGFGPPSSSVVAGVYSEANNFCAKKGLKVKTISKDIKDALPGRMASLTIQFQCIK